MASRLFGFIPGSQNLKDVSNQYRHDGLNLPGATRKFFLGFVPGFSAYGPRYADLSGLSLKNRTINALGTVWTASKAWKTQIPVIMSLMTLIGGGAAVGIFFAMQRIPKIGQLLAKVQSAAGRKAIVIGSPIAAGVALVGVGVILSMITALIHNRIAARKVAQPDRPAPSFETKDEANADAKARNGQAVFHQASGRWVVHGGNAN